MAIELLAATTSATQSEPFTVVSDEYSQLSGSHHVTAPLIAGVETATVQKKSNSGAYADYYVDGTIQQITATNTGVVIIGAGVYRVNKSATAAAVSVEASTNGNP